MIYPQLAHSLLKVAAHRVAFRQYDFGMWVQKKRHGDARLEAFRAGRVQHAVHGGWKIVAGCLCQHIPGIDNQQAEIARYVVPGLILSQYLQAWAGGCGKQG